MRINDMGLLRTAHGAPELAGPHRHSDEYEFHYFLKGSGIFRRDGIDSTAAQGVCFFSFPGEHHDIVPDGRGKLSFYYIRFSPALDERALMERVRESRFSRGSAQLDERAANAFEDILMKFHTAGLSRSAEHAFLSLLHLFTVPPTDMHRRYRSDIARAASYMRTHIASPFNLRSVARQAGLHPSYFLRQFKRVTGFTPLVYMQRLKTERAAFLLKATNSGIDDIAVSLGYSDRFQFSKVFKRRIGISPAEYRKRKAL